MITPSYYIDQRSTKGLKALAEAPFLPLAMGGRRANSTKSKSGAAFKFEDLLSVATEALLRVSIEAQELEASKGKGVNYARKAIKCALLDHVRDDHKLVRNVEMSEADFRRTCTTSDDLPDKRASKVQPHGRLDTYLGKDVWATVYPPGPYYTSAQLLAGAGSLKPLINSKHGKVSVALGRAGIYMRRMGPKTSAGRSASSWTADFQNVDEDGRPEEGLKLKLHRRQGARLHRRRNGGALEQELPQQRRQCRYRRRGSHVRPNA